MPSFLSKVFGRKKDGKGSPTSRGRGSVGSLLDGKFEVVSPTVSPTATDFPENVRRVNGKEKDVGFGLFKVKSRQSRPSSPERNQKENLPQLSLVLPAPVEDAQARALGVAFEADSDAQILSDDVIGSRRLTPLEVLILVRTCSQAIVSRGLKTLGLMHPHWYSASPDTQRRLISLFIHSLNPNNATPTLSPSSASPASIFNSEINYTRSPHDVAAVLRWGLRHLELDGRKFGKEDSWYQNFVEAERSSEYSPSAYSKKLAPLIPPPHLELINATLDLFSSLAAHSEENSTSGSKLTKAFGLWLLAAQRVGENDDWPKFYARWQDNGRILEHLFLARIRDESLRLRMPTRLSELVAQYPFVRGSTSADDVYLRPQLSTRHFDALVVRIETEFSSSQEKVNRHPLQFLKDALAADVAADANEHTAIWEKIRKFGDEEKGGSPGSFTRVFADETIRYLTLVPGDHPLKKATSPIFGLSENSPEIPKFRRWTSSPGSPGDNVKPQNGITNGHVKPASEPSPLPSSLVSPSPPADWSQFSSTGFSEVSPSILPLASTLFGQDVEKTNPPVRRLSRRSLIPSPSRTPSVPRKSVETTPPRNSTNTQPQPPKLVSKSIPVSIVQLDEAFVEFWVDALLDPIASTWPKFVLCKLRSPLSDPTLGDKHLQYVVIEHIFVPKPASPVPPPAAEPVVPVQVASTSSPAKSVASAGSPKSSKSEKRFFGLFSSSHRHSFYGSDKLFASTSGKGKKRALPQGRVNELGEITKEEDEVKSSGTVRLRIPSPKPRKSADVSRMSIDASRRSMDARKSVQVPNSTQAITAKTEESSNGKAVDVGPAAVAAATVEEDKANISPLVGGDVAGSTKDKPKSTEEVPKLAEGASAPSLEEKALLEQEFSTAAVAPGSIRVEEQVPSQPVAVTEASTSNGHTLDVIVEKAEETTPLPVQPSSTDSDTGDKVLEAAVPNQPTSEPEVSVLAPTADTLTQEDLPTSNPRMLIAPVETGEVATEPAVSSSVDETKAEEAPESTLHVEAVGAVPEQHVLSVTCPEIVNEVPKEEIAKAETAPEPVVEPVETDIVQPSVREVTVDVVEEAAPEVVVESPVPVELHQGSTVKDEIVHEKLEAPTLIEESSEPEPAVIVTEELSEVLPVVEEAPPVDIQNNTGEAGVVVDQDAAVEHSPVPEESAVISETATEQAPLIEEPTIADQPLLEESHPVEEPVVEEASVVVEPLVEESAVAEEPSVDEATVPVSHDIAPEVATGPTDVEEPTTSAATEDSTGAETTVAQGPALHVAEEPADGSIITKDQHEAEVEEHVPDDVSERILIGRSISPIGIQQTTDAMEAPGVEIEQLKEVDESPVVREDGDFSKPQLVDTESVPEPTVEPVAEQIAEPPMIESGLEPVSESVTGVIAEPVAEPIAVSEEPMPQESAAAETPFEATISPIQSEKLAEDAITEPTSLPGVGEVNDQDKSQPLTANGDGHPETELEEETINEGINAVKHIPSQTAESVIPSEHTTETPESPKED